MTPTDALYAEINSLVTNEHIGPGYWRTRTDDWDLPAVIAQHLTALGWREPLPVMDHDAALRLLDAMDQEAEHEKQQAKREALALQCVGNLCLGLALLGPTITGQDGQSIYLDLHVFLETLDKLLPQIIRGRVTGGVA